MFKTSSSFSLHIEEKVTQKRISYMEAILEYCNENFLEPDDIKNLVTKSLKDKIEVEMIDANLLPKKATLDV